MASGVGLLEGQKRKEVKGGKRRQGVSTLRRGLTEALRAAPSS